jgi:hypothetical protein
MVIARSRFFLSSQTHSYVSSIFISFEKAALQYWISLWALKSFCHAAALVGLAAQIPGMKRD